MINANEEDISTFHVQGFAWSGGGRNIVRVEVSPDDGKTWIPATLTKGKNQPYMRAWAWTHWTAEIPLPGMFDDDSIRGVEMLLRCKATDASMNSQPSEAISGWNIRGILNNVQQRLPVKIVKVPPKNDSQG